MSELLNELDAIEKALDDMDAPTHGYDMDGYSHRLGLAARVRALGHPVPQDDALEIVVQRCHQILDAAGIEGSGDGEDDELELPARVERALRR